MSLMPTQYTSNGDALELLDRARGLALQLPDFLLRAVPLLEELGVQLHEVGGGGAHLFLRDSDAPVFVQ